MDGLHILVLAGRRDGDAAVAAMGDVSHKALLPVGGVPMLERVLDVLHREVPDAPVAVIIDDAPGVEELLSRYGATRLEPAKSPSLSVTGAQARFDAPFLLVTADHALLTGEMVRHFLNHIPQGADGVVALARRETIEAQYKTRRTYWRFADAAYSGCNLFYLSRTSSPAVTFWRQLEADRKRPWRVVRRLGVGMLLAFLFRILSLPMALRRLSKVTGAQLGFVDMPFAEAAIDVDKPEDLFLAETILAARDEQNAVSVP